MRIRFGVIALPMLAAAVFLCTGCDNSTNEEGVDKSRAAGEGKTYKSYGDYALQKAEEVKKEAEAAKAAKGAKGKTPTPAK